MQPLASARTVTYLPTMSLVEIKESATRLPDIEKGDLAVWLLDSLPPHGADDASTDSIKEASRRREELDSGKVQCVTSEEFWAEIDRESASWK